MLSRILAALNNSIKYSFINRTPTQVLYNFRIRKALDLLRIGDLKENPINESRAFRATSASVIAAYLVTRNAARRD